MNIYEYFLGVISYTVVVIVGSNVEKVTRAVFFYAAFEDIWSEDNLAAEYILYSNRFSHEFFFFFLPFLFITN